MQNQLFHVSELPEALHCKVTLQKLKSRAIVTSCALIAYHRNVIEQMLTWESLENSPFHVCT